MNDFSQLLQRYLVDLEIRGFSKRTYIEYSYHLQLLKTFIEERKIDSLQQIDSYFLREFQVWLHDLPTKRGTPRSAKNQNCILQAVKSFFKFLKQENLVASDSAEGLEYAKTPKQLPKNILTPQEAKKIIDVIDISTIRGYRDRTVLETMYSTGVRRNELLCLKVQDVNLEEEVLRINNGKGGVDRVVPLTKIACRFLETYIKAIRPQLLRFKQSETLFLSWRSKPLDREMLSIIVRDYAKLAGITKKVTPHIWRHSVATHLLKNEAKLRHVQAILGHKCLSTTEKYLHLTINDLKEAHSKFHPREKVHH